MHEADRCALVQPQRAWLARVDSAWAPDPLQRSAWIAARSGYGQVRGQRDRGAARQLDVAVIQGGRWRAILAWRVDLNAVAVAGRPGQQTFVEAVAATSAGNAWAVGLVGTASGDKTLMLHWNGRRWTQSRSPNLGTSGTELFGASAGSAHNVWAVGTFTDNGPLQPLAIHCC
jgi:hypothetical protein